MPIMDFRKRHYISRAQREYAEAAASKDEILQWWHLWNCCWFLAKALEP